MTEYRIYININLNENKQYDNDDLRRSYLISNLKNKEIKILKTKLNDLENIKQNKVPLKICEDPKFKKYYNNDIHLKSVLNIHDMIMKDLDFAKNTEKFHI